MENIPVMILYDESARIPFIVRPPGGMDGRVNSIPVSSLDLLPTVLDYAGVKVPEELPGKSVRPLVENPDRTLDRDYVVSETTFSEWKESYGVTGRMVRTRRYKYIVYNRGKHREQLFDMQEDPGEMVNLADRDEYRNTLRAHREMLREWIERTDDEFDAVPEE